MTGLLVRHAPGADRATVGAFRAIAALHDQLRSLQRLLEHLDATSGSDLYCARPSRVSGSVGEHVRHILDHIIVALLDGPDISYDSRLRGTALERDVTAATVEVTRLAALIDGRLDERTLATPLRVASVIRRGHDADRFLTTRGREVAFVVQHTVHHCAIIALLLERMGVSVPPGFGYAASTPLPAGH